MTSNLLSKIAQFNNSDTSKPVADSPASVATLVSGVNWTNENPRRQFLTELISEKERSIVVKTTFKKNAQFAFNASVLSVGKRQFAVNGSQIFVKNNSGDYATYTASKSGETLPNGATKMQASYWTIAKSASIMALGWEILLNGNEAETESLQAMNAESLEDFHRKVWNAKSGFGNDARYHNLEDALERINRYNAENETKLAELAELRELQAQQIKLDLATQETMNANNEAVETLLNWLVFIGQACQTPFQAIVND